MSLIKIKSESLDLSDSYNFTGTLQQNGASIGGNMKPAFHAYGNQYTGFSSATWTKAPLQNEVFDTDNCFDSSTNYRFTPNQSGKYVLHGRAVAFDAGNALSSFKLKIYKNGSVYMGGYNFVTYSGSAPFRHFDISCFTTDTANGSGDYYELYFIMAGGSTLYLSADNETPRGLSFFGHKIIE